MKHIHLHRDIQSRVLPQITPAAVILFMFYIIFSLRLIEKCSVPLFSKQRKIFLIVNNITRVTPSQTDSSGAKSSISVVSISRFFKAQHQHWLLFSSYRDTQKYQPALNRSIVKKRRESERKRLPSSVSRSGYNLSRIMKVDSSFFTGS